MPGQLRLRVRHRHHATDWFDYLFVSRPEMEKLAVVGGWRITRFIPDDAPLYVAVLEPATERLKRPAASEGHDKSG